MTTCKVSAREPFVTVTLPSSISGPRLLYRILRAAGHSQMFFLGNAKWLARSRGTS